jgi:hypothetical protein
MAKPGGPGDLLELQDDNQLVALVKDWDFKKGKTLKLFFIQGFELSVHHPSSSPHGAFHLLAVLSRFTFRLTETSVSLALHAVLGGSSTSFHVTCIKDRHFLFSVASKLIGFTICELKRICLMSSLMSTSISGEMVGQTGSRNGSEEEFNS